MPVDGRTPSLCDQKREADVDMARDMGLPRDVHRRVGQMTYQEGFEAGRMAERQAIVEAINKLMTEVDQIPRTATTKFASATVRSVGNNFIDLIQLRGQT